MFSYILIFLKHIIFLIVIYILLYNILTPILINLEREEQDNFIIKNNIEQNIYQKLSSLQDYVLKKKTYITPEISYKIKNNNINFKRYIIGIQFNLLNSYYFDYVTDNIFSMLDLEDNPESLDLKANILQEMEILATYEDFIQNGDLGMGFDFNSPNKKYKIYFDNFKEIVSYEWIRGIYDKYYYRKYTEKNNSYLFKFFKMIKLNLKTKKEKNRLLKLEKSIYNLFDYFNIDRLLLRYKKTKNICFYDSINIKFIEPMIINEELTQNFINFLNNFITNSNNMKNNIILDFKKNFEINKDNKIHWISLGVSENFYYNKNVDEFEINIYIRNKNNYDIFLQKLQIPIVISSLIYN